MKKLLAGLFALSSSLAISNDLLPQELIDLNGDYTIESGDKRCKESISIWGYEDLYINTGGRYNISYSNINRRRSSGRCMSFLGSKVVYKTTFDNGVLTNYVSVKRVGCLTPARFVKLEKESEVVLIDINTIKITWMMNSQNPMTCFYKDR